MRSVTGKTGKTLSGLERVVTGDTAPFEKERAGLRTHPAAITSDGRHAAHALLATDSSTGLPVHDTYQHPVDHLAGMLAESRVDVRVCVLDRPNLNRGRTAEEILAEWREPARRLAEAERKPHLLYPRDGEY